MDNEHLFGNLAAVIEKSGCTYQEAIFGLEQLAGYYKAEGELLLAATDILEIAQRRQRLYEQKATAPSDKDAAR